MERLFVLAVAADRPRLPRTPLPDHPRAALLAHLHRGHQAASDRGQDPQDHRARGGLPEDRLLAAAHGTLRPRRDLRQHARRRRQGRHRRPAGHLHHGLRDLRGPRPLGDRPRAADAALRFLVEPAARLHGVERVGAAAAIRERHRSRGPARQQVRAPGPLLGPARPPQRADDRPRGASPDGSGGASRARPGQGIRLPRRRGRHHQPRRLDLDVVARGRRVPHREDGDRPARAGAQGAASAAAPGLRRRAAAGHRHRPLHGRQVPLRLLLGNRRDAAVRRHGSQEAEARGIGPPRRHRAAHAAPERQGLRGRPADGRDQPRRQAGLLDQLALLDVGRPVLPRTACPRRRSWPGPNPAEASSWPATTGWRSPRATGRTRSGSKAATARPIRSATPRSEL